MCIHKHARNYTLPQTRLHRTRCNNRNRHLLKIENALVLSIYSSNTESPPKKDSAEVIIRIDPSEVITSNHVSLHAMKQ